MTASYYGRPVLKAPVWRWPIPAYFFTGGLAASSSTLAYAARLTGRHGLARTALGTSSAALAASTAFLIEDLGRPARFANMLRVAKVTSPMSVGTWLLSAFGAATTAATFADLTRRLPAVGRVAEPVAAALGPPVATYTAVLVADTAVPAWHDAYRELPFVFAASAAASGGAAATLLAPWSESAPARTLAVAAAAAELAATVVMQRRLGPTTGAPYHSGRAATLGRAAKALTATGAGLVAAGATRRPALGRTGAAAVLGGALLTRFSVFQAGFPGDVSSAAAPGTRA
ncbi:MAG: NrfD/PsrC family molybdoenzyme membrane anchor subunit [Acidimicrobiia bacterium]